MKKHELFYSLDISDIQEIADQDLERELTEAELKKVIDTVPKYIKWDEAISYAFMELRLPTKDELIKKKEKEIKKSMNDKTKILETFENKYPNRDYKVKHIASEFTSLCPKTGQPDFATIILEYIPGNLCVELKSYKFYLQSYRNEGIFFESVTNKILDDLVEVLQPRWMKITANFNTRGGISSVIETDYEDEDYWYEDDEDLFGEDDDYEDDDDYFEDGDYKDDFLKN